MSFLSKLFGQKDSQSRIALTLTQAGQAQTTPANYASYSKQGYQKNVIAYRCISMIAQACAGIKWELYQQRTGGNPVEIENHDLLKLLAKPNPMQGKGSFFEYWVSYYKLAGNSYIEAVRPSPNKPPYELWPVRPDKITIIPSKRGYPAAYVLDTGTTKREWLVDQVTLQADLHHLKSFHPNNEWFGMSPLEAAMISLDQNNSGQRWNLSLLQNSATPSGVMQVKVSDSNPTGSLTEEQFARLKSEVDGYSGAAAAGRPMLIEGGMEWKQISISPKDMEFLENKNVTAADIAMAYGVPPEMLGLGQKTYANYEEARASFYEDTILPLMDQLATELNNWLVPMFGKGLVLVYDRDDIEALATKREKKFATYQNSNWLTQNEKRQATGYEPVEGWDVFSINGQLVKDPAELSMVEPMPEPPPEPEPDDEEEPEVDDEMENEAEKGWKSFNLVNNKEKQASYRRQNAKRDKLAKAFEKDLSADFKEMYNDFGKALSATTEPKLLEYSLSKVVDENMPVIEKTIQRHLKYTVEDFGQATLKSAKSFRPDIEVKGTRQYEDWARRYIKTRSATAITQIEGTTRKNVLKVVKELVSRAVIDGDSNAEIAKDLQETFASVGPARASLIARTEVASASNYSTLKTVESLQLPNMYKEWVSSTDDRVRDGEPNGTGPDHLAMNGVSIPLEDKFTVPPDTDMDGPGDMSAGPEFVCNCRCALVYSSRNTGGA